MKSAYEIAMEKLGEGRTYSAEQKARLAEIDQRFEAKKAEFELAAQDRLKNAVPGSPEEAEVREELARDLARISEKRDQEKQKVRDESDG